MQEGTTPGDWLSQEAYDRLVKRTPKKYDKLPEYLLSEYKKIERRESTSDRQRQYQMFMCMEFYQCKQYGFFESGSYINPDVNKDTIYYQCDYFSEQVFALLTQWMQTEIELIVNADENSADGKAAARAASIILAYYSKKLDTPTEEQLIGLRAILQGGYLIYTYFDPACPDAGKYKVPIYGSKEVPNDKRAFNCDCGAAGPLVQASFNAPMVSGMDISEKGGETSQDDQEVETFQCPACAKPVEPIGPETMTELSVSGYKEGYKGSIKSRCADGLEIMLHPSARACQPETSPWLCYRTRVLKSVLEDMYWYCDIPYKTTENGLRLQQVLERQLGSFASSSTGVTSIGGGNDDDDMTTLTRIWFDVACYAPYCFPEDTKFKNGVIVPAGVRLSEVFPDGIYIAVVNNQIVDIRNENKNDHWVGGAYHPVPNSSWGLGIQSALWQQRLVNDAYNFMVEAMRHLCSPLRLFNASTLDGNDIAGNPSNLCPVNNVGPDGDITKLFHIAQAPQIPESVPQFIDRLVNVMQRNTGAGNGLLGQSQMNVSATDARQSKDAAIATATLPMRIKAQAYARRDEQRIKLIQKHYIFDRSFPTQEISNDYSKMEVMKFSAADIDRELYITFSSHSIIPKYLTDRRNDLLAAIQAGAYNDAVPVDQRRRIADVFQQPVSADKIGKQSRKAEVRYDAIVKEIAKFQAFAEADPESGMTLMMPHPETGLPSVIHTILSQPDTKISIEFDDHKAQMEWCSEWGNSDKGLYADEFLFQVITARFHEHSDAMLQVNQSLSADAALASQPQIMAAQAAGQQLGGAALPAGQHLQPQGAMAPEQPGT